MDHGSCDETVSQANPGTIKFLLIFARYINKTDYPVQTYQGISLAYCDIDTSLEGKPGYLW
ncbi:hypothetical protein ADM99_14695 [Leptolinea tardivitalis]|uniref:Uncharacterized protein n=1 Tax=Leptolinea tardivitalis TaxID=229920 RepID=A0A0P6WKT7_9CHLR|nr:hypothetical protein ADM99_14695 [Leptolinea tardivitalis]